MQAWRDFANAGMACAWHEISQRISSAARRDLANAGIARAWHEIDYLERVLANHSPIETRAERAEAFEQRGGARLAAHEDDRSVHSRCKTPDANIHYGTRIRDLVLIRTEKSLHSRARIHGLVSGLS